MFNIMFTFSYNCTKISLRLPVKTCFNYIVNVYMFFFPESL